MTWVFSILVVLVLGAIAAVAVGRGAPMSDAVPDRPDALVPATGPVTGRDLRAIRFPLVLRGYRMADVDALLDRLATQLDDRPWEPAADPSSVEHPRADPPLVEQPRAPASGVVETPRHGAGTHPPADPADPA